MSVLLAFTAATLFGVGTYLVMQRKLSRIIIGIGLLGHGANILLITAGRRGAPPLIGSGDPDGFADPLPQALALTAIVISFGVTALLLALAYRSWLLTHDDEVVDDVEDRAIARHGRPDSELLDEQLRPHVDADDEDQDDEAPEGHPVPSSPAPTDPVEPPTADEGER